MVMTTLDLARDLTESGLSVVPVRTDGSKRPTMKWAAYQKHIPSEAELLSMFGNGAGLGIIGGSVSGHLEILEVHSDAIPIIIPAQLSFPHHPQREVGLIFWSTRLPILKYPPSASH